MVKFTVGDGSESGSFELPAMRGVTVLCKDIEHHPKDDQYEDRLKFIFEILEVEEEEEEEHVGKEHHVYCNTPQGKTGKLSSRSNLYGILEGLSGGEFDPNDEIETDDYVGKKFTGDFKRVQKQKMVSQGKFAPAFDDDGKPLKKTVLTNLHPVRVRKPKAPAKQSEYDWDGEEDAA